MTRSRRPCPAVEEGDLVSEVEQDLLTQYGVAPPTLWTRFELVEIEVPAPRGDARDLRVNST